MNKGGDQVGSEDQLWSHFEVGVRCSVNCGVRSAEYMRFLCAGLVFPSCFKPTLLAPALGLASCWDIPGTQTLVTSSLAL